MVYTNTKTWVDNEQVRQPEFQEQIDSNLDYFHGKQPSQTVLQRNLITFIPSIGGGKANTELAMIQRQPAGVAANWTWKGLENSAWADGDKVIFYFVAGDSTPTNETIGKIQFERQSGGGNIFAIYPYSAGSPTATPAIHIQNGKMGIWDATPSYELDVNGTIDAIDYTKGGKAFFPWYTSGGARYDNNAQVTGQLISTLATGTAPLITPNTALIANLNADFLDGSSWPSSNGQEQLDQSGTAITSNNNYTNIASITVDRTGYWVFIGQIAVEFDNFHRTDVTVTAKVDTGSVRKATVKHIQKEFFAWKNITCFGAASVTNLDVVRLQAKKDAGGANPLSVVGSIVGWYIGP